MPPASELKRYVNPAQPLIPAILLSSDAAVVEVGLGGRLDATNVVVPRVAAVTTISFVTEAIVVPVPERRSEDPGRVAAAFARRVPTRTASSGREALDRLRADLAGRDEVIVVAGSLFLVGEVRAQALGGRRDPRVPQNFLRL